MDNHSSINIKIWVQNANKIKSKVDPVFNYFEIHMLVVLYLETRLLWLFDSRSLKTRYKIIFHDTQKI